MPKDISSKLLEPTTETTSLLHGNTVDLEEGPLRLITSLNQKNAQIQQNSYETYDMFWSNEETEEQRKNKYKTMTNTFYNLVTDFYEYGWGTSFHFARRCKGENLESSISRHEEFLFAKAQISKEHKVLDVGCGVGGPATTCIRFTGAHVTGLNNNDYQLEKARKYAIRNGQAEFAQYVKGDFLRMPFPDSSFDVTYAIEATCHSPDLLSVYKEMYRVLKPGGRFAIYEWCTTDKYNPEDPEHVDIVKQIEYGNSLPKLYSTGYCLEKVKEAGFNIVNSEDISEISVSGDLPWYKDLFQDYFTFSSLKGFFRSRFGSFIMGSVLYSLSLLRIVPGSARKVNDMLNEGAMGCARGGKAQIFTPSFLVVAEKPLEN